MQNLIINEELKTLLPPLSAEEYAGLEASILKDGCLSDLIAWNGTLVDGHHRYEICKKHEIPFGTKSIHFETFDDAKLWIWKHQENRRNLTPFHRGELALKLKDVIAAKAKERQGTRNDLADNIPPKSAESKETRQELAKIADLAPSTLGQVQYITEHADEETKEKLRQGEKGTSINKVYNQLKTEEKSSVAESDPEEGDTNPVPPCPNTEAQLFDDSESEVEEHYPPLSQPIPEKDSQFVQTVKLQNIPVNDPERLIACLFDLFNVKYREKLVPNLMATIRSDDGEKTARRIMAKLNKMFQE